MAKYSSPKELTSDGILIVTCKNSVVANELFNSRIKLNEIIKKKAILKKFSTLYKRVENEISIFANRRLRVWQLL